MYRLLRTPAVRRAVNVRFLQTTSIRRADAIQQLYLDAVKDHKVAPLSAKDAEGQVRPWSPPKAPAPPASELDISEVSTYESQAVEVEGSAPATEGASAEADDWFVIEELHEEH